MMRRRTQKTFSIFLISSFYCLYCWTQPSVNLAKDLPFFQEKAKHYQRWLNAKEMGKYLKVDSVWLEKEKELGLFLSLRTVDPDTAIMIWEGLEKGYSEANKGAAIGESLFRTFVRFMEVPSRQANVQVYFPAQDGYGYDRCFYIWFWEEEGKIEMEKRLNDCRGPQPIEIQIIKLRKDGASARLVSNTPAHAGEVFKKVLKYARERYEEPKDGCENRYPKVVVNGRDSSEFKMSFVVTDLCREVLIEEKQPIWCRIMRMLSVNCNNMRRERLEFTLTYSGSPEGYFLTGEITGKYGSGIYRPRAGGYLDMEPDFEEDFLLPYVDKFQKDLKWYLERN